MEFQKINTQESMQQFILSAMKWGHAFIREIHAVSPSYQLLDGKGTANPDAPIDILITIITDYKDYPGVTFLFEETERIEISFTADIELKGIVKEDRLEHKSIAFSFGSDCWIEAKEMEYRILGNEVLGNRTLTG